MVLPLAAFTIAAVAAPDLHLLIQPTAKAKTYAIDNGHSSAWICHPVQYAAMKNQSSILLHPSLTIIVRIEYDATTVPATAY